MNNADDFARAAHRQSTMLLDNIGIKVKVTELPNWYLYQWFRDRYYGSNWLTAIWSQRIRPVLFPNVQRKISEGFRIAQILIRQEMLDAVLRQGNEMIGGER